MNEEFREHLAALSRELKATIRTEYTIDISYSEQSYYGNSLNEQFAVRAEGYASINLPAAGLVLKLTAQDFIKED